MILKGRTNTHRSCSELRDEPPAGSSRNRFRGTRVKPTIAKWKRPRKPLLLRWRLRRWGAWLCARGGEPSRGRSWADQHQFRLGGHQLPTRGAHSEGSLAAAIAPVAAVRVGYVSKGL